MFFVLGEGNSLSIDRMFAVLSCYVYIMLQVCWIVLQDCCVDAKCRMDCVADLSC